MCSIIRRRLRARGYKTELCSGYSTIMRFGITRRSGLVNSFYVHLYYNLVAVLESTCTLLRWRMKIEKEKKQKLLSCFYALRRFRIAVSWHDNIPIECIRYKILWWNETGHPMFDQMAGNLALWRNRRSQYSFYRIKEMHFAWLKDTTATKRTIDTG